MKKSFIEKLKEAGAYIEEEKWFFDDLEEMNFKYVEDGDYYTNDYINVWFEKIESECPIIYITTIGKDTEMTYGLKFYDDMTDMLSNEDLDYLEENDAEFKSINRNTFEVKVFGAVLKFESDYKWNICKLVSGKDKIADLEYCDLNDIDIYRDFE